MAQRSSVPDSVRAEKQLLEMEAMLGRGDSSAQNPALMNRSNGTLSDRWQPPHDPQARSRPESLPVASNQRGRTAYLDGLRGFAALIVYSLHHQNWAHSAIGLGSIPENAFGWDNRYYFICLPGIRILFSGGHFAVSIFFVISGYALSSKPLRLIQSRETSLLADNLTSALFRRWLRLYIPVICTTFVWMTSWHVLKVRSSNGLMDAPMKTYSEEIVKWYRDFKNFSWVFTNEPWNHYNDHTWSIPLEFRGSIVIYTTLLALARSATKKRLLCEVTLIWYFLYVVDGWYCALFIMGMLLCDLDLLVLNRRVPMNFWQSIPSWASYLMLAAGLYLGGVPSSTTDFDHLRESPGWYWLSFLKPQAMFDYRWFYFFWAATFVMVSIPRIPWIKAFFESNFCQYLGHISFALYLVHGPVLWTIGDRVYAATGRIRESHLSLVPGWINLFPFPGWGPMGLELNYLVAHLILFPITLLLAEAGTKFFDEPSLRFSQWLFKESLETARDVPKGVASDR